MPENVTFRLLSMSCRLRYSIFMRKPDFLMFLKEGFAIIRAASLVQGRHANPVSNLLVNERKIWMDRFHFAASLEASLRKELENVSKQASPELQPFLDMVNKFQVEFELLLDRAQYTNVDTAKYPAVEATGLLGNDATWQKIVQDFGQEKDKSVEDITVLWMLQILMEKSGQFYLQAAANSAHPAARLFFSSMAEAKGMLRRRFDGMLRVLYNETWANLGFAPFILGKD